MHGFKQRRRWPTEEPTILHGFHMHFTHEQQGIHWDAGLNRYKRHLDHLEMMFGFDPETRQSRSPSDHSRSYMHHFTMHSQADSVLEGQRRSTSEVQATTRPS
jgi:hypothetical protein